MHLHGMVVYPSMHLGRGYVPWLAPAGGGGCLSQHAPGQRGCGQGVWMGVDRGVFGQMAKTATDAVGMHPTGMNSCWCKFLSTNHDAVGQIFTSICDSTCPITM